MKTERLFLRERTPEVRAHLLSLPFEEQLTFLGVDEERLNLELGWIKKGLVNYKMDYKMWDLILLETNQVIGDCGFHSWYKKHFRAEVGYGLTESFRKQGFMLEALSKILEFGFSEMELNRVEAFISPDNKASRGLVEKCNFQYEGLLRQHYNDNGEIGDSVVYGLLKSEFKIEVV